MEATLSSPRPVTEAPQDVLGGVVTKVAGRQLEVRTLQGLRTVVLAEDVIVDEGAWTAALPIAPGDQVFLVGHATSQGWVADKVWVNAVNITGTIQKCHLEAREVVCEIKTARPLQNKSIVQGWLPRQFLLDQDFHPASGISLRLWQDKTFVLKEGAFVRIAGRMYQGRLCIINIFEEE